MSRKSLRPSMKHGLITTTLGAVPRSRLISLLLLLPHPPRPLILSERETFSKYPSTNLSAEKSPEKSFCNRIIIGTQINLPMSVNVYNWNRNCQENPLKEKML